MPLSDTACRQAKPKDKPYKLTDGGGLYLLINQTGKYWRWDYRHAGKRKTLALGVYPETTLAKAREKHQEARKQRADGIDPSQARKDEKLATLLASANSFEAVAGQWFNRHMTARSDSHKDRTWNRLVADIFPWLGTRPISEIKAPEVLECLRRIEGRGAHETAQRVRWSCSKVFRYGISIGVCDGDPAELLKDALTRPKATPFPTLTDPIKIAELLRAMDDLSATFTVKCAARLAPLLFVRPGELRKAEWKEIDLDARIWRIPADKMKSRAPHHVPLADQVVNILRELQALTGHGQYVFPGVRNHERPMSEATLIAVVRRLGYGKEEFTPHSFRKIASTVLNESQLWHKDAIERQLAHGERDEVRAAYNHAEHWAERQRMMQWYADHLDVLKAGGNVIPLNKHRAA